MCFSLEGHGIILTKVSGGGVVVVVVVSWPYIVGVESNLNFMVHLKQDYLHLCGNVCVLACNLYSTAITSQIPPTWLNLLLL